MQKLIHTENLSFKIKKLRIYLLNAYNTGDSRSQRYQKYNISAQYGSSTTQYGLVRHYKVTVIKSLKSFFFHRIKKYSFSLN